MRQDEQVRVIRNLMKHIDHDTNVDAGGVRRIQASEYTSVERAEIEWATFFRSHAQVIGMSGDLPRPKSFLTVDDFGVPVLATRDQEGRFRAFVNVCRHRGTIVESGPRGEKSRFVCPFHAWTYDSSGALIGIPKKDQFGSVDAACLGLVELPAVERHGFLWVHPQPDGQLDAKALLAGLDEEFESWNFGGMMHTGDAVYETPMNWKLAIDTFGETYHFEVLHRNTLAPIFRGNVQGYDVYGRNHRMALCKHAIEGMRDIPQSDWRVTAGAFPVYYLFPNVQVNVGDGNLILVRVYPVAGQPGKSFSRVSFYATPEAVAANPEFVAGSQRAFAEIIRDEDYVAAASSYRGAASGQVKEFIFGRNEPALHHYHNTYHAALGLPAIPLEDA